MKYRKRKTERSARDVTSRGEQIASLNLLFPLSEGATDGIFMLMANGPRAPIELLYRDRCKYPSPRTRREVTALCVRLRRVRTPYVAGGRRR
ncbi:hypothetical protein EVAR_31461_1 [Eumeta japonica]|uniref:Uncharacterized protein n=1 Tax=Eumeta variegata TaxID=151549 RepID=A0A4C1WA61_EUMVA|nr:hypothetical protein EVAR_31461_1 [Eumeta japonica]